MKTKYLLIVALFGFALMTTSCTPESIEDEQTEQQIDRDKPKRPAAG